MEWHRAQWVFANALPRCSGDDAARAGDNSINATTDSRSINRSSISGPLVRFWQFSPNKMGSFDLHQLHSGRFDKMPF
jgi:hypothetical protein